MVRRVSRSRTQIEVLPPVCGRCTGQVALTWATGLSVKGVFIVTLRADVGTSVEARDENAELFRHDPPSGIFKLKG